MIPIGKLLRLDEVLKPSQYQQKARQISKVNTINIPDMLQQSPQNQNFLADFQVFNHTTQNRFAKLIKQIDDQELISDKSILNRQNFKTKDYLQISIIPLLNKQMKYMIGCYLQIQTKIDPSTKQFFKNPEYDKYYWQIINEIMKQKNVIKMWDVAIKYWEDPTVERKFSEQIYMYIYSKYKQFACLIQPKIFFQALIFQNIRQPHEQNQVQLIQTQVMEKVGQQTKKLGYHKFSQFQKKSILRAINEKRQLYKKDQYFFFAQAPQMDNYQDMIVQMLHKQTQMIDQK